MDNSPLGDSGLSGRARLTVMAQLADIKERQYRCLLGLTALAEVLEERGVLEAGEWQARVRRLDRRDTAAVSRSSPSETAAEGDAP